MADDELLEFNFGGVEPAVVGTYVTLPKGEYTMQCLSAEKCTSKTNKPMLKFVFAITNHPAYEGYSGNGTTIWHLLEKENAKFLLNSLMCLIPEKPWQQDGIKVPLSTLLQQVQGRPVNGIIDWKVDTYEGKDIVKNDLKGLKPYDASITPPVASEGNPPVLTKTSASETKQAASAGVPASEVNEFLSNFPGGTATPAATLASDFGLEPF